MDTDKIKELEEFETEIDILEKEIIFINGQQKTLEEEKKRIVQSSSVIVKEILENITKQKPNTDRLHYYEQEEMLYSYKRPNIIDSFTKSDEEQSFETVTIWKSPNRKDDGKWISKNNLTHNYIDRSEIDYKIKNIDKKLLQLKDTETSKNEELDNFKKKVNDLKKEFIFTAK